MQLPSTPKALPATPIQPIFNSTPLACVQVYERLQRWRYRQRLRWPGLFRSLTIKHFSEVSPPKKCNSHMRASGTRMFKMTATMQQDHTVRVYVNCVPICICDGCGALLQLNTPTPSSVSTVSPPDKLICITASSESDEIHRVSSVRCDQCAFTTPLGVVRRMLCLPSCGPVFAPVEAFALLAEAVSVPAVLQTLPPEYRPWFLDPICRTRGLDALISMLGLRDEFLISSPDPLPQIQSLNHYAVLAEHIMNTRLASCPEFPQIPFSISTLIPISISVEPTNSTIERYTCRASALVSEAQRLCRDVIAQNTHRTHIAASLFRIRTIATEYQHNQVKVRLYNHIQKPFPIDVIQNGLS